AFLMLHVAGGVNMDERADAGHDQQHEHGQLVDREIAAHLERAALQPGEVVLVDRIGREVARRRINLQHETKGRDDAQNRDQFDHGLRQFAPKNAVDQKANERQRGDDPEILHQFLRESTSSMFRVVRFLNTVRMMARPTAASAAATTITKKVNRWPATCLCWFAKVTKLRLTALSISSMHMKIVIILRRKINPATPITNRTALSAR